MEKNSISVFFAVLSLLIFVFSGYFYFSSSYASKDYGLQKIFDNESVIQLTSAAIEGNVERIDQLIAEGVNVNFQSKNGTTPLLAMMGFDNLVGYERLLFHGANPNIQVDNRHSVINYAANADNLEYLRLALKYGGDPNLVDQHYQKTVIFNAIRPGGEKHVDMLIKAGADLNFQTRTGSTPLHVAAGLNQYQLVYQLLDAGADYNIENNFGYNFLKRLEENNIDPKSDGYKLRAKVIQFMQDKGIDVNPKIP